MTDQPPPPPTSPSPSGGGGSGFCGECGTALDPGSQFCGSCGAATAAAGAAGPGAGAGADPTRAGGASTWTGVQPVVERPTDAVPPVSSGPGGPTPPPGPGGPGGPAGSGGPPPAPATSKSKGPLIAIVLVVLAALGAGAFFLLGGDDDEENAGDETTTTEDEDEDETTTTTEAEETTTTGAGETTTTAVDPDDPLAGITFVSVQDDTGALVVDVPDTWSPDGRALSDGTPNIQASPDFTAFRAFDASGVSFTRLAGTPNPDDILDFLIANNNLTEGCTGSGERSDFDDGVFVGRAQRFTGCSNAGSTVFEIVGSRADGVTVEVTVSIAPPDPEEIIERIVESFNLTQ